MTYSDYLKTSEWRKVRDARKKLDSYRCVCCGSSARVEVHHVSYPKNWFDTKTDDLRTLCKECHLTTHRIIEHIQSRKECLQDNGSLVSLNKNPALIHSVRIEIARKIVVMCWRRCFYSSQMAWKYADSIMEIANKTADMNVHPPKEEIVAILGTVKDCFIANNEPIFDSQKRKYAVRAKTRFK